VNEICQSSAKARTHNIEVGRQSEFTSGLEPIEIAPEPTGHGLPLSKCKA
jgi:hypothetical protein